MYTVLSLLEVLIVILPILLSVAFVTICERKTMGSMQRRLGPNAVGYYGLLQPFADALKLLVKETVIPANANKFLFFSGPIITLIFALLGWGVIPFGFGLALADFNLGLLYSLAVSSLGVYGILIAGWSANSKYAFLGCLRSTAQMISYELVLSSIILLVVFFNGHFNLSMIISSQKSIYYLFPLLPLAIIFFIGALAETNRAPFDLPEAESELVAGFMTEHSAAIFVFFFLAEYANIILISTLTSILFLGGFLIPLPFSYILDLFNWLTNPLINIVYLHPSIDDCRILINYIYINTVYSFSLGVKVSILLFIFIWIRASFPRLRFDQLISLCWTIFLPIVFAFIILLFSILFSFDYLS